MFNFLVLSDVPHNKKEYFELPEAYVMCTYLGEVHADSIVMPLAVTHLGNLPPPLCWLEDVQVIALWLLTQQEHQATVVYKQGVVVTGHLCKTGHGSLTCSEF